MGFSGPMTSRTSKWFLTINSSDFDVLFMFFNFRSSFKASDLVCTILKARITHGMPDFVFIDSINFAGIDNQFLELLKSENEHTSFIVIVQATKAGNFKGDQALTHNCDFIIEVADKKGALAPRQRMKFLLVSGMRRIIQRKCHLRQILRQITDRQK